MVEVYSAMKPDAFQVAVANRPDSLLRGYQGDCERQRLHQVQGRQAQIRGRRQQRRRRHRRRRPRRRRSRPRPRHPAGRGSGIRTLRGGASTGTQPWGQERGTGGTKKGVGKA
jgi:hypothetical protein